MTASKPQFGGERVKVSDVFDLQMGKTPSRKNLEYWNNGDHEWVSIKDLGSYSKYVGTTKETISELGRKESGIKPVPKDTLIMSFKLSLGKTAITTKETYTNEAIMAFLDRGEYSLDLEYMWHQFRTKNWEMGTNIAVMGKTLNKKTLGASTICVPSILQQQKIAMRLNFVQNLIDKALGEVKLLENLVKSRFVEMFGDIDEWHSANMSEVCSIITDGTHQPPKFVSEGIPFLFVSNIAGNVLTYETTKYVSEADYEILIKRTPIEVGDVLVSAVGSFGHPAVVRRSRPFCFQRHIAYLKPKRELIDSDYLHAVLLTDKAQRYMDKVAKGVAQRTVTLKSFKEMMIPLPPLELQQEFADFVAQVDKSGFAVRQQIEKLQLLYDSLAQEYFGD